MDRLSPLLSVNKANLVSLRETDQTESDGETLREFADRLLADAGPEKPAARILLLSYPRIFGYVFNPLSVYFAYDDDGALIALIYAVRNTFGQRHTYVARIEPGDLTEAGVRQARAKLFHVSPFIGMDARYQFRILPPGRAVRLRIHETEAGEPLLSATFVGQGQAPYERSACGVSPAHSVHDLENHGRNSLGSAEALAQGRPVPQIAASPASGQFQRSKQPRAPRIGACNNGSLPLPIAAILVRFRRDLCRINLDSSNAD